MNTITMGSLNFATASKLLEARTRRSVLMLYAWCRYCDDVIDGQILGHTFLDPATGAEQRLAQLKSKTRRAYAGLPMDEPAFVAFQYLALNQALPLWQALDHLEGFAMDVRGHCYETFEDTIHYCYHVAGIVGLMIAHLLGIRDDKILDRACDLGLAFQLTNIARDLVEDANIGRCYLPTCWLSEFGLNKNNFAEVSQRTNLAICAARLITEAEQYYISAKAGFMALPWRSAFAMTMALNFYRKIGHKVKNAGVYAWDKRQSTNKLEKMLLLFIGTKKFFSSRFRKSSPRPSSLWQRPRTY